MRRSFAGIAKGDASHPSGSTHRADTRHYGVHHGRLTREEAFEDYDGDDDRTDELGGERHHQDEELTGYSRSGAQTKNRAKQEKRAVSVIAPQQDTNWMEERKRRLGRETSYRTALGGLSSMLGGGGGAEVKGNASGGRIIVERSGDEEEARAGLQIRERRRDNVMQVEEEEGRENARTSHSDSQEPLTDANGTSAKMDEDAAARAALLSDHSLASRASPSEKRVIALERDEMTEEEAFQRDVGARPDAPSMNAYAAMPVEEFGAALLRGMGWQEGMGAGRQRQGPSSAPEVKRRAALLGLGAKERSGPVELAGEARKQGAQRRPERRYVPVIRREKESGSERERSRSPLPRRYDDAGRDGRQEPRVSRDQRDERDRSYRPPGEASSHHRYEARRDKERKGQSPKDRYRRDDRREERRDRYDDVSRRSDRDRAYRRRDC